VRTFTLSAEPKTLDLTPFPGVTVKLDVTNRGTTYLITKGGKVRVAKTGLM